MFDELSRHFSDRLEIELNLGLENVARSTGFSSPLYRNGRGLWREMMDRGGNVDVAATAIDRNALPPSIAYKAFKSVHIADCYDRVKVRTSLLVVGFPLGFHDTLYRSGRSVGSE